MKIKLLTISILVILSLVLGACAPAVAPTAPPAQVVKETVVVQATKLVETTKLVEATKLVVATQLVEKVVVATPAPEEVNPYRPVQLFEIAAMLKKATEGKAPPAGAKYALLTNAVAPFWTAAAIGAQRASAEIGVPISFQAPTAADKLTQQLSMLETMVADKYNAITFSSIDRKAPASIIKDAISKGISVLNTDSDATGSERYIYVGMSDYDAGKIAGEAAKKIVVKGKMVGLVGYATAQNAQDRIAGFKDAIKGSDITLEEVLLDDIKPEVALSNAQTAMQKYPDLAGFITLYSYDGPAAGQAVKAAGKTGQVKVVAFDAEPETQRLMSEGVVQVMIGQRVYFYGYLAGYLMNAFTILGKDATMKLLEPYLDGDPKTRLNTGVDVIYADSFPKYKEYLNSIGIPSQ